MAHLRDTQKKKAARRRLSQFNLMIVDQAIIAGLFL
jgi:hypothetical protein